LRRYWRPRNATENMEAVIWYWIGSDGKVQITDEVEVAEKALHEHKQVWGCNKMEIDLGLLGVKKDVA